jgi:hypothetical protein
LPGNPTDKSIVTCSRMCTLTGTPDSINAARAQINAVIANEGNRMGGQRNGGMGGGGMGGMGGGGGNFEMMIEGPLVARVIGKGGENIKRLQEETGAKIVIIQVNNDSDSTFFCCLIHPALIIL